MIQPSTKLAHYEIVSALGKGGMGEVWRGRDTNLGREVAIKTLPAEFAADRDHLSRFRREARAASALNHPNICIVYDLAEHDGQPFIVMELLRGETLKTKLERGPLPVGEALDLAVQLADGLDAAHSEGIIHRDIKPANIFVTDRGTAKLLDFGLARIEAIASEAAATMDDITGAGTVLGTVSYMSPEQARGEELDARSDLFSLGVVLYEMVTGQTAFTGNTSAVIFDQIFNKTLTPPTRFNAKIPKELDMLIGGLLEKDRRQRSSSARDLGTAIARIRRDSGARPAADPENDEKSIVVLPFENLSADAENEYFSDGLTEEIITDLSQIHGLRVISRNSSMQLKGTGKDLRTVASELNVRYLLTGSVRKAANAVRVAAQLIDPLKDQHLWADKYSGKLEDIFEIQEQISRKIVDALKMRLSPQEDRKLAERPIDNVEAFECYHRARREIYKFTEEGLDRALELIQKALDIVGDNELLYAARGNVYRQYVNAALRDDEDYIAKAQECADQIFAINPDSALGHELIGMIRIAQGRMRESIESFKTALATQPNSPFALNELGRVYLVSGSYEACKTVYLKILAVDATPINLSARLENEAMSGHIDRALGEFPLVMSLASEFMVNRLSFAIALINNQEPERALELLEARPPEDVPTIAGRLCAFLELGLKGRREDARMSVSPQLQARARRVEWWSYLMAECYALIDEAELAVDWLETAFRLGFMHYPYVSTHSVMFRKLDGNPAFEQLLGSMKVAWERFEP